MYAKVNRQTLADIVEGSGLKYKKSVNSYIFDCPKCGKRDKLYMRRTDGRFICFYCAEIEGFRGKAEYALAELLSVSIAEAKEKLYGIGNCDPAEVFLDVSLRDLFDGDELPEDTVEPMAEVYPEYDFVEIAHKHGARGAAYLESRGIPVGLASQYGIMYHPRSRRVIFPVSYHGRLYGWQARSVIGETPKIITSTGLKREQCVMFADRLDGNEHVVLCEGPVDAIKAHLCGGNVASMGKVISRTQVNLLRNSGVKRIYLALDPDAAQETEELARNLLDLELYLLHPCAGKKDLGDMSLDEVYAAFKDAPKVSPGRIFYFIKPLPTSLALQSEQPDS